MQPSNPDSKISTSEEIVLLDAAGHTELNDEALEEIRKNGKITLIVSMCGRSFDPDSKRRPQDEKEYFGPPYLCAYYNHAKQKELPVDFGLGEEWLNIIRAYLLAKLEREPQTIFLRYSSDIAMLVESLQKKIYAKEVIRRKIQYKSVKDLIMTNEWVALEKDMQLLGAIYPMLLKKKSDELARDPFEFECRFSWRKYILQIDKDFLNYHPYSADHPEFTTAVTDTILDRIVSSLDSTGLSPKWIYYLLAIQNDNLEAIEELHKNWFYSWEDTETNEGIIPGTKHTIIKMVKNLTKGEALYMGYMILMSLQYQFLDWIAYQQQFSPLLPITAFGKHKSWHQASQSDEYKYAEQQYYKNIKETAAKNTLDNSVISALEAYHGTTEYRYKFSYKKNCPLFNARIKLLMYLHQIRENAMVLTLPLLDVGGKIPYIFYPHKGGWDPVYSTIFNYHIYMNNFYKESAENSTSKRARFAIVRARTISVPRNNPVEIQKFKPKKEKKKAPIINGQEMKDNICNLLSSLVPFPLNFLIAEGLNHLRSFAKLYEIQFLLVFLEKVPLDINPLTPEELNNLGNEFSIFFSGELLPRMTEQKTINTTNHHFPQDEMIMLKAFQEIVEQMHLLAKITKKNDNSSFFAHFPPDISNITFEEYKNLYIGYWLSSIKDFLHKHPVHALISCLPFYCTPQAAQIAKKH